jgi:hypothetical protein
MVKKYGSKSTYDFALERKPVVSKRIMIFGETATKNSFKGKFKNQEMMFMLAGCSPKHKCDIFKNLATMTKQVIRS